MTLFAHAFSFFLALMIDNPCFAWIFVLAVVVGGVGLATELLFYPSKRGD